MSLFVARYGRIAERLELAFHAARHADVILLPFMKTLILSLCVSLATCVALGQPDFPFGAEFPVTAVGGLSLPVGTQSLPAAAFDGTNHLVVWADYRGDKGAIFGARISPSGQVLDPVGFLISDPATDYLVSEPAVAWNGEHYLVVWEDYFFSIRGRFVSPEGGVLDSAVRELFSGSFVSPLVASNGDSFLVLNGGSPLAAVLMDERGRTMRYITDPQFAGLEGFTASVASDGSDYVVAVSAMNRGGTYSIPISSTGTVGMRHQLADSSRSGWTTRIAWTGQSYLTTWIETFPASPPNQFRDSTIGRYVGKLGVPMAAPFLVNEAPARAYLFDLCTTGTDQAVVVWNLFNSDQTDSQLRFAEVQGMTTTAPTTVSTPTVSANGVVVSCAGTNPMLFWTGGNLPNVLDVYYRSLNASPSEARSVTESVARQTHASTVATNKASLLLWQEQTGNAASRIQVGRIGFDGRVIQGTERPISPSTGSQKNVRGATNGSDVFVVWTEEDSVGPLRLLGTQLGARGEAVDSQPLLISANVDREWIEEQENPPAIAWNGQHYLVAWPDSRWLVRFARITSDGVILDPEGVLVPESARKAQQSRPALAAANDGSTLLTWQDGTEDFGCVITCPAPPPSPRVLGVLIAPGGTVASSQAIEISPGTPDELQPAVAWNGHHFLVVWRNGKTLRIEGTRITAEGQVFTGSAGRELLILDEGLFTTDLLSIVADEEHFVVAWSDAWSDPHSDHFRIVSSIVDKEGIVRGPGQISPGLENARRPAILRTHAGGLVFYYDRNVPETPYLNVRRIFGRGTTGFTARRRPIR